MVRNGIFPKPERTMLISTASPSCSTWSEVTCPVLINDSVHEYQTTDKMGHDHANVASVDASGHVSVLLIVVGRVVVVSSLSSGTVALTIMGSQREPFLFVSWTPSPPFKEEQVDDDESTSPTFLR
jgi:hypothetical protein